MKHFLPNSPTTQDTTDPVTQLLNEMFDSAENRPLPNVPNEQVSRLVNEMNLSIDDVVESLILDMNTDIEQVDDTVYCLIKDMKGSQKGNKK